MESELDPRKMFRSCIIVTKSQGLIKHRYLLEQLLFLEIMFFDKDVGFHWKKRILLSIIKIFRAFYFQKSVELKRSNVAFLKPSHSRPGVSNIIEKLTSIKLS